MGEACWFAWRPSLLHHNTAYLSSKFSFLCAASRAHIVLGAADVAATPPPPGKRRFRGDGASWKTHRVGEGVEDIWCSDYRAHAIDPEEAQQLASLDGYVKNCLRGWYTNRRDVTNVRYKIILTNSWRGRRQPSAVLLRAFHRAQKGRKRAQAARGSPTDQSTCLEVHT